MLRVKRGASNRGHHHRDRHRTIIVHIEIPFHGYALIHDPLPICVSIGFVALRGPSTPRSIKFGFNETAVFPIERCSAELFVQ